MNYILDTREFIALMTGIVLLGVPFSLFSFHTIKRLKEIKSQNTVKGDIFITNEGDMYCEFDIPATDIMKENYILLKVNPITVKEGSKDEQGNRES